MIPLVRDRATMMRDVLAWRDVRFVVSVFCLAQILDGITTYVGLASHQFQEANPLLGGMLDSHPIIALVMKLLVAAVVVTGLLAVRLRWRLRLTVITLFAIVSMVAPLANLMRITGLG